MLRGAALLALAWFLYGCGGGTAPPPDEPPTVLWLTPIDVAPIPLGATVGIDFALDDPEEQASYVVLVDGIEIAAGAFDGPRRVAWDTSGFAPGAHTLTLRATDAASVAEDSVDVVLDEPPTAEVVAPLADRIALLVETAPVVEIRVRAGDREGAVSLDVVLEDGDVALPLASGLSTGDHTFAWETAGARAGTYTVVATVDDGVNPPTTARSTGVIRVMSPDGMALHGAGKKTVFDRVVYPDGSVLVVGEYSQGAAVFAPGTNEETRLQFSNDKRPFLARFAPDLRLERVRRPFGGTSPRARALVALDGGEYLLGGSFGNTGVFLIGTGPSQLWYEAENNGSEALQARYGADDGILEVRVWTGEWINEVYGLAERTDGAIAMGGFFNLEMVFASGTLQASDDHDAYVAVHDADGDLLWVRQIDGPGWQEIHRIAALPNREIVTMGWFTSDTVELGDGHTAASDGFGVFLTRHDENGEVTWSAVASSSYGNITGDLATWPDGSIVATGHYYWGDLTLEGVVLPEPSGGSDAWIARWRPDGTPAFVRRLGARSAGSTRITATYADGSFVVEGDLNLPGEVDGIPLTPGPTGRFAARFAPDGSILWASAP
jgi:hypothetical protein